jgi:DNA-binding NtrC family response regulator/predicted TIM-barrel enzyme
MADIKGVLQRCIDRQARVVGVVTGSGEVARAAVSAEADLLIALNAGLYRQSGHSSLAAYQPYGNANEQTEAILHQHILPHAGGVPVVAGICSLAEGAETTEYLKRLKRLNVSGVTNWPSVGLIDGAYREALEDAGLGSRNEVALLQRAREMGFVTFAYAYNNVDVRVFLQGGADALILTMGVTRSIDDIREKRDRLQRAIVYLNGMLAEVKTWGRRLPCLAYGGPITSPDDAEQLFRMSNIDGFAGGSVFERLPMRDITGSVVRSFKSAAAERHEQADSGLGQMIGSSAPMRELFALIRRIAPYDVNVCIEGESGTGKELVATHIHRMSSRAHQPFVTLNCGAIPETLLESELFGHEKGAFTGAERRRLGKFELANRGTLFLDEIATLSPHGQVSLLRALQQREITRVGAENTIPVDVRVLAASNQRLNELVEQGGFRADLYHRLNQITLQVPPLRERLDDLPLLLADILRKLQIQLNRKLSGVAPRFMTKLQAHAWTGNIRELQHAILHAALREDGPLLEGAHFAPNTEARAVESAKGAHGDSWKQAVRRALRDARGNKSRAAAALGVTRRTLYAWLREIAVE